MTADHEPNTDSRITKPIFGTFMGTGEICIKSMDMINQLSQKGQTLFARTDIMSLTLNQESQKQFLVHPWTFKDYQNCQY